MRKHKYQISNHSFKNHLTVFLAAVLTLLSGVESNGFYDANEPQHIHGQGNKQISDINVLLPISTCVDCRKIIYNISAINGCYQWEVSHPNLIDVQTVSARSNPECANIAQLSALAQKPSKSLIWISARDRNSGQVLRCEAKLNLIQKLEIQTHLRQFYVDDYEHLHIAAYDDEGNIFNSLEGFRFEWNIETGTDIVKIVSMKEAAHKSSDLKKEMEFSKLHSDVLFLKGLRTGTATLSVRLLEPGYENVQATYVTLTITEPFVLIPQKTVYLLPTSKFQFQLAKVSLKSNDMQFFPIQIPSRQYQWNIDQEEKADIGEDGLFISKDKEGFVNLLVVDQYIANNTAEGSAKIVHPSLLDLEIVDVTDQMLDSRTFLLDSFDSSFASQLSISHWDTNWILVEGNYYLMKVFLFDREKQPIHLTENLVFNNILDDIHFEIIKMNKIKSEFIVRAKRATEKEQKLTVISMLKEIVSQSPYYNYPIDSNRLRAEKEVRITRQVNIIHPTDLVLLPLIKSVDESRNGELWQLIPEGGSGYYSWSILDDSIASISGSGLVRSKEIGITKVVLRDNLNSRNMKTINVEVTPVFHLTWLESHIEILKNSEQAYLNVIALDQHGRKFTNCTAVATQFETKGEGILESIPVANQYTDIVRYVNDNKELMFLKQQFDENPNALTPAEFSHQGPSPQERQTLLLHNNFGICQMHKILGVSEGLGRVKAYFSNFVSSQQSRLIESNYAEIASYDQLKTMSPSNTYFFTDLYSKSLVSQEEQNFGKYYAENIYDIAFGSSALWVVQGGTNFWKDIPEKYQVQETHILTNEDHNLDRNALHFESVHEQATVFKYSLSCQYPGDKNKLNRPHHFRVNIRQHNIQTRHLLRPASHQISIEIHCEPPKDLKLHWAQEEKSLMPNQYKNLPRHKIISSEKNHFVLVNSRHFVRSLMFDQQTQVFYNHSSILTEMKSSNDQLLKLYPLRDTYDDQVRDGLYDKRRVEVSNITGTVYIDAVSVGYLTRYLKLERGYSFSYGSQSLDTEPLHVGHEVKDRMRIEIVQNVDIQPKYKSIYLAKDNSFKFQIMHGSGHFSVSINNTELADRHHIEGDRFITIYPKKEGPIEIRVEDIELPDSIVSTAELLISDIYRLELDAPGTLIEQGQSMDLQVTAIDLYNRPFDIEQYLFMKFHIEIEITQQRERGLIAEQDQNNNRMFLAKGQEPGLYQVIAISSKYRPVTSYYKQEDHATERYRITSEVVKIEVFPLLQIHPASLLLTPEMKYTLQIVGGPSRSTSNQNYHTGSVEIRFDMEDKGIATVDVFREVTGHEVGDTKLYYEIIQLKQGNNGERRSIISKKTIPIRVRLVTDIEIPYNNQRNVYSGSMIKMIGILKYHTETFTHGVAPISYSWNCSNPGILSLNSPSKADIKHSNALTTTLIMASKKIRDNSLNSNEATFLTNFNSSTIYSLGGKQGEALVTLQLAIEYPDKYRNDQNWFTTKIIVRVNEKLSVEVPEYIHNSDKSTHLYLMPPNSYTKIETNKKTRLRLGYSQQSVYDYSTNSYQYKDSTTPIIQLVNEEGIRTFDKYGKVTVIIEENQAFSDQVVMLNVLITDIYNLASKDVYQALSFPLGSTMSIPLKFQNEHAHTFAKNIEGIQVGIEMSHPRVVSAQLDQYNQTIQMRAEGSGDCNIVVYLVKQPHIYDVFRVRVSSVVKPYSPVNLHVGGQVQFKIMDQSSTDYSSKGGDGQTVWSSNNPTVLDINQATGEARGLSEGRAEILLSNHISAASIAQVSRVKHAEIDEQSRKNLVVNTDEYQGDKRIRVKFFLHDQIEELTPSVQFDGITLIKQNVGIKCESEHPELIEARGEVSDLEGFYCIISFRGTSKQVPKSSKIFVTVYAPNPNKPEDIKQALYKDQIMTFEIQFVSKIQIESFYKNGVSLNKEHRTATVKIFSNTHFNVFVENDRSQDRGFDLVKFRVNKTSEDSTEYFLTVTVPREITHDFTSRVILTHPGTGAKSVVPIIFQGREGAVNQQQYAGSSEEGPGILDGITNLFSGKQEKQQETGAKKEEGQASSYLIPILVLIVSFFFMINVLNVDPVTFISDILNFRNPFGGNNRRRDQQMRQPSRAQYNRPGMNGSFGGSSMGGGGIRSSNLNRNQFPNQDESFMKKISPGRNSPPGMRHSGRGAVDLGNYPYSARSDFQNDSIYGDN